jgi:hypothetical protein
MNKTGLLFKGVNVFGKRFRVLMFGVLNAVFCTFTLMPVYLWYTYEPAALVFYGVIILLAAWNGTNFTLPL